MARYLQSNTRIHKDHPIDHVIGDVQSFVQTRRMTTSYSELGFLSAIYEGKTLQDLHTCLFACFLSQEEPKRVSKALSDQAWVEAMQEELLQFKLQKVWILVDLPKGHRAIDGAGFDWSDMAEAEIQANMALMAFSDSEKNQIGRNNDALIIEDWVSDDEDEVETTVVVKKKTVIPTAAKIEKPVRKPVKYAEMYRPVNTVRSVNTSRPFSTARSFNTVRPFYTAHPKSTIHCARPRTYFQNQAQSTIHRPFYKRTALTKRCFNQRFNTGRPFRSTVNTVRARGFNAIKPLACWVWRPIKPNGASLSNSQLNDKGFVDSGCSRHMTGNIAHLSDFKDFDGGYVTFGGGAYGGRITGKGTIKTDNLDFDDVYFVKELKFNLFSVSQMCDKKNYVLFTDSECLVLSPNFKLPDENQILLKIPRQDNMYSFDMKNIVPKDSLTCLVAKATSEESMLWHRRLGHINFKNINKLVKENLVRDLPLKRFENDQTCVACLKGKQHRASCKTKAFNPITKPLFMLHMDLFGPTFVSSLMHKKYCLVVTDDYSRFSWVFFLTTKDETSEILKIFIKEVENLVDKKVKIIRSDNGTEFKNKVMEFENTQNNALAKLPMLKLGEYEMWEIRIKQYFQIQDYALWEVIENGNSWVPIPVTTPPEETGTSTTTKMTSPATIEEKTCKKNDVKARSLLLMALPNEHQLTFDQYVDAQSMFAAIKARFGGNEATKKTQKALLKQQYENFSASSSESLDSIFNRLQKLVSRLAILGVVTPPEDLNVKFLRSLPSEWDTHVVVWMNKPDFDTMGLDDLYNNFKIVEQKVKKSAASNDDKNLAFVTTSGASSNNNINAVNPEVSTATTKVNTASTEICTASFRLLRTELEKVKQEKERVDFRIAKFDKSAKDLNEMLESQITDKSKKRVGLEEFKEPEVNEYGPRDFSLKPTTGCDKESDNSKENTDDSLKQHQMTDTETSSFESPLKSLVKEQETQVKSSFVEGCGSNTSKNVSEVEPKKVRNNNDAPIIEDWVLDDEEQDRSKTKPEKKTVIPTAAKIKKR
ncbi:putative ribonuclease H-like domain-containing protein [Tanacetum coccineum]